MMIKKAIAVIVGVFLYLFDPEFRAVVRTKLGRGGINEEMKAGEDVVAVLNGPSGKRVIKE